MNFVYKSFIRPLLFCIDPEKVHDAALRIGRSIGAHSFLSSIVAMVFKYRNSKLSTKIAGIHFENPVGLAAGFDKNGVLVGIIGSIGFGFSEIGSVTALPCQGNPKPRLWRLPQDKSIAVSYGLVNNGAEQIASSISKTKKSTPLGISIAKTNSSIPFKGGSVEDYAHSFSLLELYADYITLNVSCPNAADGREFCEPDNLKLLLNRFDKLDITKPIFIKLKPDITNVEFDAIFDVCIKHKWVTGFVISNITHNYDSLTTDKSVIEKKGIKGGISGKPVEKLSNNLLSYAYKKSNGRYIFIGCGGVFSAEDAYEKIKRGASLVQLITGMIYEGPGLIKKINKGLVRLLKKDGFKNIVEAVGTKSI